MSRLFFESIKVVNGEAQNLEMHRYRVLTTTKYFFGKCLDIPFETIVKNQIELYSDFQINKIYKLRVVYSDTVEHIELLEYFPKKISSLKIVEADIDYSYKWNNRDCINELYNLRGECSDVLIVKNGLITDTSYANIVLSKDGDFFTPKKPLLNGTKRLLMLSKGVIKERDITPEDIVLYSSFYLINSMLDMYPIDKIIY